MDQASNELVTIFGGSGFVGTQIVQMLAQKGFRMRIAVRRPDLAGHLRPLGAVGQIAPIQANVRNAESVAHAVRGASIVINLVGIGFERGNQNFDAIHIAGAHNVAAAAKAAGASRLIHMSILGADPRSPSSTARSRARGEVEVLATYPEAVIMRPSIMFGPGDGYFNLMAALARYAPIMPLIGGKSRFQPIYVRDVAQCIVTALDDDVTIGQTYNLCGPKVYTLRELVRYAADVSGKPRPIVPLGPAMARLQALTLELLPGRLMSRDNLASMTRDNVCDAPFPSVFRLEPTALEAVAPMWLAPEAIRSPFDVYREHSGR